MEQPNKTDKPKEKLIKVVRELPTQPVRIVEDESTIYQLITIEEALELILNKSDVGTK